MKEEGVLTSAATPALEAASILTTEIVTDFQQLADLAAEWEQLWEVSSSATIFQSLPWARAWWRGFGSQVKLCAPVVRHGRTVVGILPLVHAGTSLRFLGVPGADYNDILCREEIAPEVVTIALRALLRTPGWRTCRLSRLRQDSQLVRCAGQLPAGVLIHLNVFPVARRSALVLGESAESVVAAVQRKSVMKRHRNKLYRTGEVRFRHVETRAEAQRLLPSLFQQHIARRALAGESSQFLSREWQDFYASLLEEFDLDRQLRFSVLELDGRAIAYEIAFESRGTLLLYKPTFDVNAWELSPGDVLLSELLEFARQRKLEEVDFTIGDELYKEHFTNYRAPVLCAILERSVVWSRVRGLLGPGVRLAQTRVVRPLRRQLPAQMSRLRACSTHLWRTRVAGKFEEPLVYLHDSGTTGGAVQSPASARPAHLSDLAELALGDPRFFDSRLLHEYRVRLRNGDCCHLLSNLQQRRLVWTRRITLPEGVHENGNREPVPADVLYDVRLIGQSEQNPLDGGLMDWFAHYAGSASALACVYLTRRDRGVRRVLEQAGFQCRMDLAPHLKRQLWPI